MTRHTEELRLAFFLFYSNRTAHDFAIQTSPALPVQRFLHAAAILQTGELYPKVSDMAEEAGCLLLTKPIPARRLALTLGYVKRQSA